MSNLEKRVEELEQQVAHWRTVATALTNDHIALGGTVMMLENAVIALIAKYPHNDEFVAYLRERMASTEATAVGMSNTEVSVDALQAAQKYIELALEESQKLRMPG